MRRTALVLAFLVASSGCVAGVNGTSLQTGIPGLSGGASEKALADPGLVSPLKLPGSQDGGRPLGADAGAAGVTQAKSAELAAPGAGTNAALGLGSLQLVIHWPSARQVQNIPLSTQALRVYVTQNSWSLTDDVARIVNVATQSITVPNIKAGICTVDVSAWDAWNNAIPAGANKLADGVLSSVTITRSMTTAASVSLVPLNMPQIQSIASTLAGPAGSVGQVGDAVFLRGVNLAKGAASVSFHGTAATILSQGHYAGASGSGQGACDYLQVTVPSTVTGKINASVDGVNIPIDNQPLFWVARGLSITANAAPSGSPAWDSNSSTLYRMASSQVSLLASITWSLATGDNWGAQATPSAAWNSSDPTVGTVTPGAGSTGVLSFAANPPASATTVTAQLGSSLTSNQITVTPVRVAGVSINPSAATINLAAPSPLPSGYTADPTDFPSTITLTATVTYAPSTVTNHGVTWRSLDTNKATVDSHGLVTAGSATGDVSIVATAVDDTTQIATATVTVQNQGVIDVQVN